MLDSIKVLDYLIANGLEIMALNIETGFSQMRDGVEKPENIDELIQSAIDALQPTYADLRRMEYNQAWSMDEFQEAVLEYIEGKTDAINGIINSRNSIKTKYPKE